MPGTVAALTGIGTALTAGAVTGTAAAFVGGAAALSTAGSLATTGLALSKGSPKPPPIPQVPKVGAARKQANSNIASAIKSGGQGGKSQTIKTGPQGISDDLLSNNQSPQSGLLG